VIEEVSICIRGWIAIAGGRLTMVESVDEMTIFVTASGAVGVRKALQK
jgi:hypothetical protein